MSRVYPRTVWVLQPSFKPVQIEVVEKYKVWQPSIDYGDVSDRGKRYSVNEMHETKEAAIAAGRAEVERMRVTLDADIAKRTDGLNKRIAALDKAEGK